MGLSFPALIQSWCGNLSLDKIGVNVFLEHANLDFEDQDAAIARAVLPLPDGGMCAVEQAGVVILPAAFEALVNDPIPVGPSAAFFACSDVLLRCW